MSLSPDTNYYEILQVSRHADPETIHRVFRIMAMRFHPDNPETGSAEKFHLLHHAYRVLSDPEQRARYDAAVPDDGGKPSPVFELKDFVLGVEGEMNRRLGILSLLYQARRIDPDRPGVSVLDLEKRMAFPREYLCFTVWYLKAKGYISMQPNSDYELTAEGVDFVESNSSSNRVIRAMLAPPPLADVEWSPAGESASNRVC
jgi:hypothetical protein